MSNETIYSDEPMQIGKEVNILPSPAELANMARTERATLTLTKATLDFFREQAEKEDVSYNVLIRNALDEYIRHTRS
ncbi:MAG: CopG family transcriptional regulator [Sphaerospermopsis sp. SIO1G2]|nr:CopG family transcriptional regulator [Sphaerospermopsis sp. SIO1G2]